MTHPDVGPADPILLYGATGYTAGLVIERLLELGVRPVLAGRNQVAVQARALQAGLTYRVANLEQRDSVKKALEGMRVMLNLAGPFVSTAGPAVEACVEAGAHYLDVSGEVDSIAGTASAHALARSRGVMLMAGTGFDVVPSDCLCAHVARRLGEVHTLRIGVAGLELASQGSLRTLARELGRRTRVWRNGALSETEPGGLTQAFDFGAGPQACTAVSWGDVVTAPLTTGAKDVETYFALTPMVAMFVEYNRRFGWAHQAAWVTDALARFLPQERSGPTAEQRAGRRATIVVEGWGPAGRRAARLETPEVYSLTAHTAADIAVRVLGGDTEPGFQTPARLFGPDFILSFSGVTRTDDEAPSAN